MNTRNVCCMVGCLFVIGVCSPVAHGQRLYWTDGASNAIYRAGLNGSIIEQVVTDSEAFNPTSVALDMVANKLYWVNNQSQYDDSGVHDIYRANLDGSEAIGFSPVICPDFFSCARRPLWGIVVDSDGGRLYWSGGWIAGCFFISAPHLGSANLDGSDVALATYLGLNPRGIAFDSTSGKFYGTDWGGGGPAPMHASLYRTSPDGLDYEDIIYSGDLWYPEGIALDQAAGKVYWVESAGSQPGRIRRADLDGSNMEDLVTAGTPEPRQIALDAAAGKMYWTDSELGTIQRADLDGSNVEVVLTSPGGSPIGIALDLRAPCCLPDGTCALLDEGPCLALGGTASSVGLSCERDQDGDGLDGVCGDECPQDANKEVPGICGCGVSDADDDGDGVANCVDVCPGADDDLFAPGCGDAIPTVSEWGLAVLALLLLVAGKVLFARPAQQ